MRTFFVSVLLLMGISTQSSFAQERPGLAQVPGEHENDNNTCLAEVSKLRKVSSAQRRYIDLLEKKVQLLEQQAKPVKKDDKP